MSHPLDLPLENQSLVFDRSHWGRIRLTGADRVRFLHNQTTHNIEQLSAGQGCYSVFVTSTGRTIDLATVYAELESLLVVVSPDMGQKLYDWMDRYIFFSDKVTLTDESAQTFMFTILGNNADSVLQQLGATDLMGKAPFSHQTVHQTMTLAGADESIADEPIADESIRVAVGTDLGLPGYTLWGPKAQADAVWQAMLATGAVAGTPLQWEILRIQQGRPAPGHELTDDDNPLEAGLWNSISFEKGCYIGQETIARLNTYQGVKKRLWGLRLTRPAIADSAISVEGTKIGRLTSVVESGDRILALAYLRTKAGGAGLQVTVENAEGELIAAEAIALPFIQHEYYNAKPS